MSKLSKYISKLARNLYMKDVLESIEKSLGVAEIDVNSIQTSIILQSTLEEIEQWEQWLLLPKMNSWTLQDRIDRVVYTLNSQGFFTRTFLKEQAKTFTNGEIQINEQFDKYHFEIEFTSVIGLPPNLDNFADMVEVNKPAKLTWSFKFRYRTHKELQPFTHKQLQKYTHKQLHELGIITI